MIYIHTHHIVDSDLYNNILSDLSLSSRPASQPVVDYPVEIPGQGTTK